ncbi:HTH_Tnp_Tc3_2 domain-containing protein [Trichonephila clavipes]|nr:HTH_Tnp_Tc3_2 domain-containing protein [Trichonephila clavipes]
MKTAGWSTRRVAGQVDRSGCAVRNCWEQWTRRYPRAENRVWSDQEDPRGERIEGSTKRQHLWTPRVTRSTIRADVGVAIVPQKISRYLAEANLKIQGLVHSFNTEHRQFVYSGAKIPDQRGMSQIGKRLCLVMNPGLFSGQMINVCGCWRRLGVKCTIPPINVPRHTARTAW